jgi:hypothetical protein
MQSMRELLNKYATSLTLSINQRIDADNRAKSAQMQSQIWRTISLASLGAASGAIYTKSVGGAALWGGLLAGAAGIWFAFEVNCPHPKAWEYFGKADPSAPDPRILDPVR